ncbi:MAG TPA: helix-turn-helix domain-containing protein [Trueperaceae bacterium]|nr:helix-turn-helix domain-containing protein [Trueperaceae bacterium]
MSPDLERVQFLNSLSFLTAQEAGELLRTGRHEIYRLVRAGHIACTRFGKKVVISREELDRFMREGHVVNTRPMTKQVRRHLSN